MSEKSSKSAKLAGLTVEDLFNKGKFPVDELLEGIRFPWEIIPLIAPWLKDNLKSQISGEVDESAIIGEQVRIDEGVVIEANAVIKGPVWIQAGALVRSGAYIRENVIVGKNTTIGNSCELKNSVIGESAEVPHFNYVGDSILGYKAHTGAGVILSNVKLDRKNVIFTDREGNRYDTGLRKFGTLLGDGAEIGCNSVLSPGTVIGKESIVYPCAHFSGQLAERSILKVKQDHKVISRRD